MKWPGDLPLSRACPFEDMHCYDPFATVQMIQPGAREDIERLFGPGIEGDLNARLYARSFSCGLNIGISAHVHLDLIVLDLNRWEPEHACAHLGWALSDVYVEPEVTPEGTYALKRQDDNGNIFVVVPRISREGGQCMATLMEQRGHKQMYWAEQTVA